MDKKECAFFADDLCVPSGDDRCGNQQIVLGGTSNIGNGFRQQIGLQVAMNIATDIPIEDLGARIVWIPSFVFIIAGPTLFAGVTWAIEGVINGVAGGAGNRPMVGNAAAC